MRKNFIDISGQRFGRWTVLRYADKTEYGHPRFLCRCDCGTKKTVLSQSLRRGMTTSCGCYGEQAPRTHGMSYSHIYKVWTEMKQRCRNPKDKYYPNYGGRGIKVCERWQLFENFYADMGEIPKGHQLDRKDNDGNYCAENCRWATRIQQQNNTRKNFIIKFNGHSHTLSEWARIKNIKRSTLQNRVNHHWPLDKLFIPVKSPLPHN